METIEEKIKLTSFSHGAGCGCKIAPAVLSEILAGNESKIDFPGLLVGNDKRDDAAVFQISDSQAVISTTDFFMPIVDDPFDFGRIAATNAISDVYAMGGTPFLAIAILGWPIDKIPAKYAGQVIAGARSVCEDCGIALGGGHSIDCPEPVFGLAVNGLVHPDKVKQNSQAKIGDKIFLTKRLGVGILSTASKKGKLSESDLKLAINIMTTTNKIGAVLGNYPWVHAMTDVTGFGLLGHLSEMSEGSGLTAVIDSDKIPRIEGIDTYIAQNCIPGGTNRNWSGYGHKISLSNEAQRVLLCDPQTSGGLLIAVDPGQVDAYISEMKAHNMDEYCTVPIGSFTDKGKFSVEVL